ncbi:MAG TPA: hypothetical protein VG125_21130 [Pirellulales bacterium]|jgi:hypothetical protein|nr:hypothetical protein [Pirellulales bacterium]
MAGVKRRVLQFSLRGLLGLAAFVCLALGCWHLLETYGTSLKVESPRVGELFRVKATNFRPFGPPHCALEIVFEELGGTLGRTRSKLAERSWGCFYATEIDFEPIDHPCQVIVYLQRHERTGVMTGKSWLLKERIVDVK